MSGLPSYFKTKYGKLFCGDSLENLKRFPDNCIQCCVTSPPYWALRDYGTAIWVGGDEKCDHKIPATEFDPKRGTENVVSSHTLRFNRKKCYKCGAIRVDKQVGLEDTPEKYIMRLVEVFREVRRILKEDGTLWVVIGDSYNSQGTKCNRHWDNRNKNIKDQKYLAIKGIGGKLKIKDLVGIPWMLAFALRADGWYLRQDIIWHKPNAMPEAVKDRCTKAHEYIFLFSKAKKYYYDYSAIQIEAAYDGRKDMVMKGSYKYKQGVMPGAKEQTMAAQGHERWQWIEGKPMKNKRSVWTVSTKAYKKAHFATFPSKLIIPCILAGTKKNQIVLDPFCGANTVGMVCERLGRLWAGIELSKEYCELGIRRIKLSNLTEKIV